MPSVWAPFAKKVELLAHERPLQMRIDEVGWWHTEEPKLTWGEDYWFIVDGERLPDPRSPWQPAGVFGPSRHVDHAAFRWNDKHWQAKPLSAAVFYELHIGTFTQAGTFEAAIERLDHLVRIGITHVEIMPVAEFLGEYGWGYDGVFPYAPHHAYGGPMALKRFVDACHSRGLAVVLDVVYNHQGPRGNVLPKFGPYFTDRYTTPWGGAFNFDGIHSDEVRRFFCDNAIMWLRDYHFDGLRLDAVHAMLDTSAVPFLEQLATEVDELKAGIGRHLVLIAESDLNDPRVVRPWELGGYGLDAQWSDDIHHSLHTVLTGERDGYYADFGSLTDLATAMARPYVYDGKHSIYRKRRHGRPAFNLSASRFLAYLQNHDQLGNRPKGDRLAQLVNADRTKMGAALVILSPYVPLLFQGEEWAASSPFLYFVDFTEDPDLAALVRDGRRNEFAAFQCDPDEVPDPSDKITFLNSKLHWDEIAEPSHCDMLVWYRQLISLRAKVSAFTDGRLDYVQATCDEDAQWLRIERGPVTIVCNFANQPRSIPLSLGKEYFTLLVSKSIEALSPGATTITVPRECVVILGPAKDAV